MREIERAEGGSSEYPSAEEIKDFWQSEREVRTGSPAPKRKKLHKKGQVR